MTLPSRPIVTKIIFPIGQMRAAVDYYSQLGFHVERYDDGYAWVRHGGEEVLHLRHHPDLDVSANPTVGYFHVADADGWHAALTGAGVKVSDLQDLPWQMREFRLTDPFGNVIRFGQNL